MPTAVDRRHDPAVPNRVPVRADIESTNARDAAGGTQQREKDVYGRRLPGAIGSEQAENLTFRDRETHAPECDGGAEAVFEPIDPRRRTGR